MFDMLFSLMCHALSTLVTTASLKMEHGETRAFGRCKHLNANSCFSLRCSQAVLTKFSDESIAALRVGRICIGAGSHVASQSSITQGVTLPANSRVECDACDRPTTASFISLFIILQVCE
jgi:hypothetical protein